jgi:hypothetical protein
MRGGRSVPDFIRLTSIESKFKQSASSRAFPATLRSDSNSAVGTWLTQARNSISPEGASRVENVNDKFGKFAGCFVGERSGDGQVVYPEQLDRDHLDYSVASLKAVDAYLKYLQEHRSEHLGREWANVVVWGGAYVGEVIRRNAPRTYD